MIMPTPQKGEQLDIASMNDKRLVMEALGRVAMGVQPLSQWSPVFSNPELMHLPGLRSKAFTVWFPTMLDFLGQTVPEIAQLRHEVERRGLAAGNLFEIADEIETRIRAVLSLFTKEEQLYLNDRRLQNVHGIVSQFYRPVVGVRWYSSDDGIVYREKIADHEYHDIMRAFYSQMQQNTLALLDRCVTGSEWVELGSLAQSEASMESFARLADRLGIGVEE